MENASKALIIAGAILLSILLISLGIMVYNNAKGTISDANLDSEQAQSFNTKISQYCGTNKTGTTMNSLVDAIAASNGAQKGKAVTKYITITVKAAAKDGVTPTISADTNYGGASSGSYPSFANSMKYKANYEIDNDGYINKVIIDKN